MTAHPIDEQAEWGAHMSELDQLARECDELAAKVAAAEHERDQAVGTELTAQQALDQMEHRATRAEAQSEARRIDMEYWRDVARGNTISADVWKETALQERAGLLDALEQIKIRDQRIKAVRDVLDRAHDEFEQPTAYDIRRALEA